MAGPRLLERRGVDHPQQGRDQELVREDRELPDEVPQLVVGRLALAEPARIGVVDDDAVVQQVLIDVVEEFLELLDLPRGQLAAARRSSIREERTRGSPWVTVAMGHSFMAGEVDDRKSYALTLFYTCRWVSAEKNQNDAPDVTRAH